MTAKPKRRVRKRAKRVAVIFDGKHWFVRAIRAIDHDLSLDEMTYHCDEPIANDVDHPEVAMGLALAWLTQRRPVEGSR